MKFVFVFAAIAALVLLHCWEEEDFNVAGELQYRFLVNQYELRERLAPPMQGHSEY